MLDLLELLVLLLVPLLCTAVFFAAARMYPFPVEDLNDTAGAPLVLVDRQGDVLRAVPSVSGRPGRAQWVPLSQIRSHAVLALLA
ncbi:MAG: hypothetical protein HGA25_07755, partial [Clostridiales bacterium]|nr:hypothetical protein [Clostridiales bacterium]